MEIAIKIIISLLVLGDVTIKDSREYIRWQIGFSLGILYLIWR